MSNSNTKAINLDRRTAAAMKITERIDKLLSYIIAECPEDETWKEIPWADTYYWISDKGRVLSLCGKEPEILTPFYCNGYLCVDLYGHNRRINRLVAKAFLENPEDKPIAHHKNHDKSINTTENLAWATYSENTLAYYDNKRKREEAVKAAAVNETELLLSTI